MTREKVQLAWVVNENSRTMSLKKRRLGLVKKVRELTILCAVKACLIIFSPKEAEPVVWPSVEAARALLDDFFALPDIEKKKKETTLESFLKEKTKKAHETLMKIRKKNMEYLVHQLMMQLHRGRRIADFNLNEIYELLAFAKDKIMHYRRKLHFMQHLPLRDPSMHSFEAQPEGLRITTNDVLMIRGGQGDERTKKTDEAAKMICIGTEGENPSHYLMDQWFIPFSEPPNPQIHQTIGMEMVFYNENPNQGSYLPYQGSNSNGNPNLEMEPVGPPMMTFGGFVGSREFGVKEEGINTNNGNSQFHSTSIAMTSNDGVPQEPPPNGAIAEEGNVDATLFDISWVWPDFNNHRF